MRRRKMARWAVLSLLYAVMAAGSFRQAEGALELLASCSRGSLYRLEKQLSASEVKKLRESGEQEGFSLTAWRQVENIQVQAADLGKGLSVTALELNGPSPFVLPAGGMLDQGDTAGCLMDRDTLWELYGDTNLTERRLFCQGRELTVRGLLPDCTGTIVYESLPVGEKELAEGWKAVEPAYTHLSLQPLDETLDTEGFLLKNGVSAERLPLEDLAKLGGLPLFRVSLPSWMIPNRWSDLDHWGNVLRTWRRHMKILRDENEQIPVGLYLTAFRRAVLMGVFSLFWAWFLVRSLKQALSWIPWRKSNSPHDARKKASAR